MRKVDQENRLNRQECKYFIVGRYKRTLLHLKAYEKKRLTLFFTTCFIKPLQLHSALKYLLVTLVAVNSLFMNTLYAQILYKIEVDTVAIHQQPSVESSVVHRLYSAENIQLLKIHNKWVKIRFDTEMGEIEGWTTKTDLKVQQALPDKLLVSDVIESTVKSAPATFDLSKFKVSAINGDIYCNRSKNKQSVSGCVVEIDIDISATNKAKLAEVTCEAKLETAQLDGNKKHHTEQKVIRTPLKKGKGAARMQLAVIPLKDTLVKTIKLTSYQCQISALS